MRSNACLLEPVLRGNQSSGAPRRRRDPREPRAAGAGRDSDRAAFDALPARRRAQRRGAVYTDGEVIDRKAERVQLCM